MKTRLGGPVAVTMLTVLAGGCARGTGPGAVGGAGTGERTEVAVTNHNWADVNVYAVRLGSRTRLGTVTSMTTRTFRLPLDVRVGEAGVRLMVSPIGSTRVYQTDLILVGAGDRIEWNLENSLALSSYMVRSWIQR